MSVSIAEAKSQFSAIVDRAVAGEETLITRHGKPVAKVVPLAAAQDPQRALSLIDQMRKLRDDSGATLGGLSWEDLRDEGRK